MIVALEAQQPGCNILERGEVVGDEGLTLNDRKIDLDIWLSQLAWMGVCTSTRLGKAV